MSKSKQLGHLQEYQFDDSPDAALEEFRSSAASKPRRLELNSDAPLLSSQEELKLFTALIPVDSLKETMAFPKSAKYGLLHKEIINANKRKVYELLMEGKHSINSQEKKSGLTCLHIASQMGNYELAKILLSGSTDNYVDFEQAECDIHDFHGRTALHHSVVFGQEDMCELLIESNANVNLVDEIGCTALHYAILLDNLPIIKLLIMKNVFLDALDKTGDSYLHHAIRLGRVPACFLLINNGCDISIKNLDLNTPLHYAAKFNLEEVAKLLVEKGANANVNNLSGYYPHEMVPKENPELRKFIEDQHAIQTQQHVLRPAKILWSGKADTVSESSELLSLDSIHNVGSESQVSLLENITKRNRKISEYSDTSSFDPVKYQEFPDTDEFARRENQFRATASASLNRRRHISEASETSSFDPAKLYQELPEQALPQKLSKEVINKLRNSRPNLSVDIAGNGETSSSLDIELSTSESHNEDLPTTAIMPSISSDRVSPRLQLNANLDKALKDKIEGLLFNLKQLRLGSTVPDQKKERDLQVQIESVAEINELYCNILDERESNIKGMNEKLDELNQKLSSKELNEAKQAKLLSDCTNSLATLEQKLEEQKSHGKLQTQEIERLSNDVQKRTKEINLHGESISQMKTLHDSILAAKDLDIKGLEEQLDNQKYKLSIQQSEAVMLLNTVANHENNMALLKEQLAKEIYQTNAGKQEIERLSALVQGFQEETQNTNTIDNISNITLFKQYEDLKVEMQSKITNLEYQLKIEASKSTKIAVLEQDLEQALIETENYKNRVLELESKILLDSNNMSKRRSSADLTKQMMQPGYVHQVKRMLSSDSLEKDSNGSKSVEILDSPYQKGRQSLQKINENENNESLVLSPTFSDIKSDLEQKLRDSESSKAIFEQQNVQILNDSKHLELRLSETLNRLKSLELSAKDAQERNESLMIEKTSLISIQNETLQKLAEKDKIKQELLFEVEKLKTICESLTVDKNVALEMNVNLSNNLNKLTQASIALEHDNLKRKKDEIDLQKKVLELEGLQEALQLELQSKSKSYESEKSEKCRLHEKLCLMEKKLQLVMDDNDQLRDKESLFLTKITEIERKMDLNSSNYAIENVRLSETLREQFSLVADRETKIGLLEGNITSLKDESVALSSLIEELNSKLAQETEESLRSRQKCRDLERCLEEMEKKNSSILAEGETTNISRQRRISNLESDYNSLTMSRNLLEKDLEKERINSKNLSSIIEKKDSEIRFFQLESNERAEAIMYLESILEASRKDIIEKSNENVSLKKKVCDSEQSSEMIRNLRNELNSMQEKYERDEETKAKLILENAIQDHLKNIYNQLSKLEVKTADSQDTFQQNLHSKLEEVILNLQKQQYGDKTDEIFKLRSALQDANLKFEKIQMLHNAKLEEITSISNELYMSQKAAVGSKLLLEEAQNAKLSLVGTIQNLELKLKEQTMHVDHEECRAAIKKLKKQIQKEKVHYQNIISDFIQRWDANEDERINVAILMKENEDLRKECHKRKKKRTSQLVNLKMG